MTELSEELQRRVDAHLDAVERKLTEAGHSYRARRGILDDLEAQIREMLAQRTEGREPTPEDVERVLAMLDAPEAYGQETPEAVIAASTPQAQSQPQPPFRPDAVSPRFSILAIIGAIWAPIFFIMILLWLIAVNTRVPTAPGLNIELPWWMYLTRYGLLPLGLMAPFGTTILGFVSASQIRASGGRLIGLGLAAFDALFFPLLLLDAVIFGLVGIIFMILIRSGYRVFASHSGPASSHGWMSLPVLLIVLLPILICYLVDRRIVARFWRWANR